jgi:hypothetical protein
MPAVPITSDEQYDKAIEVLSRVGGTWQGVGQKEYVLLVSPAQYEALVQAGVAAATELEKDHNRGKKSRKSARL